MTAESSLPSITCPSSLVASCAPLLGFEPSACVVAFILGVPGRTGPVLARMDLADSSSALRLARELARGISGTRGRVVDLVAFVDADDDARRAGLSSEPMLLALAACLEEAAIAVGVCLSTNGTVWWSHGCPDVTCCADPQPLDRSVMTRVRAEYAYAGYAPLGSRDALAARLAPDPMDQAGVAEVLSRSGPPSQVERWRDAQVRHLDRLLVPPGGDDRVPHRPSRRGRGPLTVARAARALRGLADIRVRDTVLLRLVRAETADRGAWDDAVEVLCQVVRMAPVGSAAPPATLLAIVAWMRGDGALANEALERSDEDDPGYRLAGLVRQVMANGIDPNVWRSAMAGLTESECRNPGSGGR
jgi:hypothetical protein